MTDEVAATTSQGRAGRAWYKKKRFWLLAVIVVIVIAVAAGGSKGGGGADISVRAARVLSLDGNTVRVYMTFTNSGKASGSVSCVMNTTVYDQFGDEVNIRVNSTGTNTVAAGQSKTLYQDIGVDSGDAPYVKASDVKLVDC